MGSDRGISLVWQVQSVPVSFILA